MSVKILLGVMPNRYYQNDSGEDWQGDFETALKIRWHLARQGIGVFAIDADTMAETRKATPPSPWAGVTDTDWAVN